MLPRNDNSECFQRNLLNLQVLFSVGLWMYAKPMLVLDCACVAVGIKLTFIQSVFPSLPAGDVDPTSGHTFIINWDGCVHS